MAPMRRPALAALSVLFVLSPAYSQEKTDAAPARRIVRVIPVDEALVIDRDALEGPSIYRVICGDRRVSVLVTPDGLMQCVETSNVAGIIAVGRKGNYAIFDLRPNEMASVWPVERVVIYAGAGKFMLSATAEGDVFSVRADRVRPGGLRTRVDGREVSLRSGRKLEAVSEAGVISFRETAAGPAVGADRAAAGEGEDDYWREVPAGGSVKLDPLALARRGVFRLTSGGKTIVLRLTPDGLLVLTGSEVGIVAEVRGTQGNLAVFDLELDEMVSVWPVDGVIVRADAGLFTVRADCSTWAFVVRVDAARSGGLPVDCDGNTANLLPGQRIDVFGKPGAVAWRLTAEGWAGVAIIGPETPTEQDPGAREYVADVGATRIVPGVVTNPNLLQPWHMSQLSGLVDWEFQLPPIVSE